jgi:hypothetical protein
MNHLKINFQITVCLAFLAFLLVSCFSIVDYGNYDALVKTEGDFHYTIIGFGKSRYACIVEYTGVSKDVVIPEKLGNLKVETIGGKSFQDKQLSSVFIPAGVKEITSSVFANNKLTSISLPENIIKIGDHAFTDNLLTTVIIPANTEIIGQFAFANNQLTSITLPESIKEIADHAFADNLLTSVTIPDSVTYLSGFDSNQLSDIIIPANVKTIGQFAFANNQLTSLIIPGNVGILQAAFVKNNLTSVSFGEKLSESYIDSFDNALMPCYYGLDLVEHPGVYLRQSNGWLYNGELLRISAFFAGTEGVYIAKIDGQDPEKYKKGQAYIVPAGQHTVDVGYRSGREWVEGTVTFQYRYMFEGEVYIVTGIINKPTESQIKEAMEEIKQLQAETEMSVDELSRLLKDAYQRTMSFSLRRFVRQGMVARSERNK